MLTRSMKLLGSLAVYCVDRVVGFARKVSGRRESGTCVILYYHVVTEEQRALFGNQLDVILKSKSPLGTCQLDEIEPGHHYVAITFDDGFRSVLHHAVPELEARHFPATIYVPPAYLGRPPAWPDIDERERAREVVMDAQELKSIDRSLIALGSHCLSHPNLSRLGDVEAREEIAGSRRVLEELLGRKIAELSFPFGAFDERHVEMAKEAGYERVFSIVPEVISGEARGKFLMGRVRVDPDDSPLEFALKVNGAYRWLPRASRLKRRLRKAKNVLGR
jgi:peptidoglycan/xylan/chitin deacetylase (PgdA/CDA1 family)